MQAIGQTRDTPGASVLRLDVRAGVLDLEKKDAWSVNR
jgi:hypothetical protein